MESLFSDQMRLNPFPLYRQLRDHKPVFYLDPPGVWTVFRFDDVKAVLSDHARFSSSYGPRQAASDATESALQGGVGPAERARQGSVLITTDPPRHTDLRSLVNRAFTPRAVAALEPRIEAIAHELLDKVAGDGRMDIVGDFAYPLPVIVIAELLGIPAKDRDKFKHWSDEVVASADRMVGGEAAGSQQAHEEMNAYFRGIIEERQRAPEDDLVSALLQAQDGEHKLSEGDILALCWLLLVAGNETTTNLIGNAVRTLLEHEEAFALVREHPTLLSGAIEETLRLRSPIQAMFRRAVEDVTISGQVIPKDAHVVAFIGSANRDERQFADPDLFDITRTPNPHIAFGHGIHFCLGAPLARLEAKVALTVLMERFSSWQLVRDFELTPARGFIVHGVTELPMTFTSR
ncbi:cytochrome P450 [Alicyclobacillus sp. ALC3]|uniref:cytochrome P450 n=1 Tax=Alicyclobacillus sp. ALC3 TaxID=2796143 RepID=UPI0023797C36|nr:cytochrome P450 [Alicyclobacillus sp. ALC3]WDL98244.1 cytochrome P450 [Alicyclobacillus sp. ALC3]